MYTVDLRPLSQAHKPQLPQHADLTSLALATWAGRMRNEYGSARVFEALAEQLEETGLPKSVIAECKEFANEERRHGVLCGAVVESLGGQAITSITTDEQVFPFHQDAEHPVEALLRNLLSICCLSETVAVSLIGAERLEMPEGELRELLTLIYADEVGHARFGWRLLRDLLPQCDAVTRERLGDYLEVAFAHLEEHELAHLPEHVSPPEHGKALGLCSGKDARVLFFSTVNEVIIPALEGYGLPARRAWSQRGQRRDLAA